MTDPSVIALQPVQRLQALVGGSNLLQVVQVFPGTPMLRLDVLGGGERTWLSAQTVHECGPELLNLLFTQATWLAAVAACSPRQGWLIPANPLWRSTRFDLHHRGVTPQVVEMVLYPDAIKGKRWVLSSDHRQAFKAHLQHCLALVEGKSSPHKKLDQQAVESAVVNAWTPGGLPLTMQPAWRETVDRAQRRLLWGGEGPTAGPSETSSPTPAARHDAASRSTAGVSTPRTDARRAAGGR